MPVRGSVLLLVLLLTGCGGLLGSGQAPAATVSSRCSFSGRTPSGNGDVASYDLTLTNPGDQALVVDNVTVTFNDATGAEVAADDPAQLDSGVFNAIQGATYAVIGPGQSVTLLMETPQPVARGWTCQLGTWTEG